MDWAHQYPSSPGPMVADGRQQQRQQPAALPITSSIAAAAPDGQQPAALALTTTAAVEDAAASKLLGCCCYHDVAQHATCCFQISIAVPFNSTTGVSDQSSSTSGGRGKLS